ncbi:peptidase S28 [Pelomyxa schiedti]|nr:peptidase S28 [Pelomyxa schiedti]
MRSLFVLIVAVVCCVQGVTINRCNSQKATSTDFWYTAQLVDHFDRENTDTFSQRYWVNDTYWTPGQPIFLAFAGEGDLSEFYGVTSGIIVDNAARHGALLVYLEHRYYGQTQPEGDNLLYGSYKFLNADQAMADAARFLEWLFSVNGLQRGSTKVVVWGCSYSGMLSAWFRIKYPHIALAAISGSAPVLAQADFPEFDVTVRQTLGDKCSTVVHDDIFGETETKLLTEAGKRELHALFPICEEVFDGVKLLRAMQDVVENWAQGNNPDAGFPADVMCDTVVRTIDPLREFALLGQSTYWGSCLETDPYRHTGTARSWWFQSCTEYGYFMTNYEANLFSDNVTLEWYLGMCASEFEQTSLAPDTEWTNWAYGELEPSATNILFTNGNFDPWANLGLKSAPSSGIQVELYDAAHCAPFHTPTDEDPDNLVATRQAIFDFVDAVLA